VSDPRPVTTAEASPPAATPFAGGIAAIWVRELRGRMRGKRAFIFITVYLLFLGGLLLAGLNGTMNSSSFGAREQVDAARGLFTAVIMIETLVVVALAPPYTAGSISQEREKQTFDLLVVTPVSSLSIVVGKLLSGVSYLALLVGASVPLASVAFLLGGIGADTLIQAYVVLAVTGLAIGSIGVACSAVMRKTQPATVAAFVVTAALVVGAPVAWAVMASDARAHEEPTPPIVLLYPSAFIAQADLLCAEIGTACMPGVTSELPAAAGNVLDGGPLPPEVGAGRLWPMSLVTWLVLSGVALAIGARALRPTAGRRSRQSVAASHQPAESAEPKA
jgi:ABC-type transport system involved in multi-copper enzyme maturation permease subunit